MSELTLDISNGRVLPDVLDDAHENAETGAGDIGQPSMFRTILYCFFLKSSWSMASRASSDDITS